MRVLITGASGFVGSHLGVYLEEAGHETLGIFFQSKKPLPFHSHQLDLRNRAALSTTFAQFAPDVVIHAAALSKVFECEDNPKLAHDVNVKATQNVAHWCAANGTRVIFISTDQVFSGSIGYYRESDPPSPSHVYGETKADAERAMLNASSQNLVVRSNSVLGQSLGWGESFSDWIASNIRREKPISLFRDQFRSPIHIRTLSKILSICCENGLTGILHAGGPQRLSRLETGYALARSYGLDSQLIIPDSYRSHERGSIMHRDGSFDVSKLQSIFPEIVHETIEQELANDSFLSSFAT